MRLTLVILFTLPFWAFSNSSSIDSIVSKVQKARPGQEKQELLHRLGLEYSSKGEFKNAIQIFREEIILAKKEGKKDQIADCLNEIGNAYSDLGENLNAFRAYHEALGYIKTESSLKAKILKNTGALFLSWKNFERALSYYDLAYALAVRIKDQRTAADCLNNKGTVFEQQHNYAEAFSVYKAALTFYLSNQINDRACLTYNNLAILSKVTSKPAQALYYYKQAVAFAEKADNAWLTAAIANNLGNLLSEAGQLSESERYLLKAFNLEKKIEAKELIPETLENLALNAERKGNFKEAYSYHKHYSDAQKEFINLENTREVNRLQEQFQAATREKKIAVLNKENTLQRLSISKRNTVIFSLAALFLTSLLFAYLIISRNRLRQKNMRQAEVIRQQEYLASAVIKAEEKERTRIAADLHDGIGQLFSSVKMNLSGIADNISFTRPDIEQTYHKTLSLVDQSCREVRALSHQMAPYMLQKRGLKIALEDYVLNIHSEALNVSLDIIGLDRRLEISVETVLFRVIQEAINNVIKHSKARHFDIQIVLDSENLSVMLEDDGTGFDTQNYKEGIGLTNMQNRIDYLHGSFQIDSAPGKGTVLSISIPIQYLRSK